MKSCDTCGRQCSFHWAKDCGPDYSNWIPQKKTSEVPAMSNTPRTQIGRLRINRETGEAHGNFSGEYVHAEYMEALERDYNAKVKECEELKKELALKNSLKLYVQDNGCGGLVALAKNEKDARKFMEKNDVCCYSAAYSVLDLDLREGATYIFLGDR